MPTGRVRWFDAAKGYGFITSEEGKDVFLPAQALPTGVTTLRKGAKVEYSVVDGRRGPQAIGMVGVGRVCAATSGDQHHHVRDQVGQRMGRIGDQAESVGEQADDDLADREHGVGRDRDQGRTLDTPAARSLVTEWCSAGG